MLQYTPPQLLEMNSSVPTLARAKRFSSSHDQKPPPLASSQSNGTDYTASPPSKRTSRLGEFMSRTRTASLPPRPHTASGPPLSSKQKVNRFTFKGKGKEKADMGIAHDVDQDGSFLVGAASSSATSVTDPFAAHPNPSASFVTYTPLSVSGSPPTLFQIPHPPPSRHHSRRPQTMQALTSTSPSTSFSDVMTPPQSPTTTTAPSPPTSPPTRRRGSILLAASNAISSIAHKTPGMKPRSLHMSGLGRQHSAKATNLGINTSQPIMLTEVIEISESAVRASKRREEEDEERERLRDAAAKALGIGEIDVETSSMTSGPRSGFQGSEDLNEDETGRSIHSGWNEPRTPTTTSHSIAHHTRSRSGSYIPPHSLPFVQPPPRPLTPLTPLSTPPLTVSSLSTSVPPRTSLLPSPIPGRNASSRSLSTPPASSSTTLTALSPQRKVSKARLQEHAKPVHERALPPPKIPPFPSTHSSLKPFIQRSGTFPRYYAAPSLLMFTLSKQWKNRFLVLTCPIPSPATSPSTPSTSRASWSTRLAEHTGSTPSPSYLHLFKTSGTEEREIERLEINEDSVVYVADAEVGGRGGVIKVGGVQKRKPQNLATTRTLATPATVDPTSGSRTSSSSMGSTEKSTEQHTGGYDPLSGSAYRPNADYVPPPVEGQTMWVIQIIDSVEAQEWIGAIKSAVLSQRSIRAGLGIPSTSAGSEPRGDLDVILSMRAQAMVPSIETGNSFLNGNTRPEVSSPTQSNFTDGSRSSPTSSLSRSQSLAVANAVNEETTLAPNRETMTPPPRPSITAGHALKSLFAIGGTRPRSPSSASVSAYTACSSPAPDDEDAFPEDSFGYAGASLLGMLRSQHTGTDRSMSPSMSVPPTPRVGTPIIADPIFLERKILQDSDRHLVEHESTTPKPIDIARRGSINTPRERDSIMQIPQRVSTDGVSSPSLQPPPRKRAGTVSTMSVSVSSPTDESYGYTHANGSTAESLGVKNFNFLSPSPPLPATPSPSSSRPTTERRGARASWSSVSTYGSNEHPPSSPSEEVKSRRWSRRSSLPQRPSPPYTQPSSSPPSSPKQAGSVFTSSSRHPYAAAEDSPLSRASSIGSSHGRVSEHPRPSFSSKRASTSSVQSFTAAGLAQAPVPKFPHSSRPRSSHRMSAPPPQRPAPVAALPPTPGENIQSGSPPTASAPVSKTTFRESLTLRGKRLSTAPPTSPPSSALPPRPDEPDGTVRASGHRRSSSYGSTNGTPPLYPIPASPPRNQPPFPPPDGPLPPPPPPQASEPLPSPSTSPPRQSFKRRLRIRSTPPTSESLPSLPAPPGAPSSPPTSLFSHPLPPSPILESPVQPIQIPPLHLVPAPIGSPITTHQNNPSFIALPTTAPTPTRSESQQDIAELHGPTSLSPPPRRMSRQAPPPSEDAAAADDINSHADVSVPADDINPVAPPPEVDDFAAPSSALHSSARTAVSLAE